MHTLWRTKWQSALRYGWDDTGIKPLLTFWLKSVRFFLFCFFFVPANSVRNNAEVHWQYGPVVPNRQHCGQISSQSTHCLIFYSFSPQIVRLLLCRGWTAEGKETSVRKLISSVYYNLKFFHILLLVMHFSWHTKGTKWKLAYLSITLSVEITGIKNLFTHRAVRSWSSPWLFSSSPGKM